MSDVQRSDVAHALAHAMRSALARADLAVGQLERDSATPRARRLALAVADAVADLDRLVSDVVRLVASAPRRTHGDDLREVLAELRNRHAPALAARGVEWVDAPDAAVAPRGDSALARRALALLLRIGAGCARGGGRLVLDASGDADAWSLGIEIESHLDAVEPRPEGLAELRALANRTQGVLDHQRCEGRTSLRLRFPNEASCPAS
jgi:hypothetical protein